MSKEFIVLIAIAVVMIILVSNVDMLVKFVAVLPVMVLWIAANLEQLHDSAAFYREVKALSDNELEFTPAVILNILLGSRQKNHTAEALYQLDGEAVVGTMIGAYSGKLEKDQFVEVIVCRRNREQFAMSVQQIKNTVLKYSLLSGLSLLVTIGWIGLIVFCAIYTR